MSCFDWLSNLVKPNPRKQPLRAKSTLTSIVVVEPRNKKVPSTQPSVTPVDSERATFQPKNPLQRSKRKGSKFRFEAAMHQIPHPEKRYKGGEDAGMAMENCLGVFDGVGGWAAFGVDPREYSMSLCKHVCLAITEKKFTSPLKAMKNGYDKSVNITGSSTACVIMVSKDGKDMVAANLGDSGFIQLSRDGVVKCRSKPQESEFNTPWQLGTHSDDRPKDSDMYVVPLEEDDIIICGTDGLFDNLFDKHTLAYIKRGVAAGKTAKQLAIGLAEEAFRVSQSVESKTPFAVEAEKNRVDYQGGKPDDITVVIAFAKRIPIK